MERYIYKHTCVIGVDGAGTFFKKAKTPNIDRIFEHGAECWDCLTSFPTISAECWGSMLLGVRADVHKLTNGIVSSVPNENAALPTFFKIIRAAHPDAVLDSYCNWNPISNGIVERGLNVGMESGNDADLTNKIIPEILANKPEMFFIQFDNVDGAGHGAGYGTQGHLDAIEAADGMIGRIYQAYVDAGIIDDTLFIVTADHGGMGHSHGGASDEEKYVFFGAVGKTIIENKKIKMEVRDIPSIVVYSLGVEPSEVWDSYIPQNLFADNPTPAKRTTITDLADSNKSLPTPKKGADNYLDKYINIDSIKTYLHLDNGSDDDECGNDFETVGKVYYVSGCYGTALRVSTEGYIKNDNFTLGDDSFSIAFWLKANNAGENPVVFSNVKCACAEKGISLTLGDKITLKIGKAVYTYDYPDNFKGNWTHIGIVYDKVNGRVNVYFNFKRAEALTEGNFADAIADSGMTFSIGQSSDGKNPTATLADLDEFMVLACPLEDASFTGLRNYYTLFAK